MAAAITALSDNERLRVAVSSSVSDGVCNSEDVADGDVEFVRQTVVEVLEVAVPELDTVGTVSEWFIVTDRVGCTVSVFVADWEREVLIEMFLEREGDM